MNLSFIVTLLLKKYFKVINGGVINYGQSVKIDLNTSIIVKKRNYLFIEDGVYLRSKSKGYHAGMPFYTGILIDGHESTIRIGENSRLNGVYVHAKKPISIGKNCVIASGVNIIDSNGHIVSSLNRTIGRDEPIPIVISDNVWIGLNSVILKGTIIGENSVVGANSVVKGSFPSYSLIQGNPAISKGFIIT